MEWVCRLKNFGKLNVFKMFHISPLQKKMLHINFVCLLFHLIFFRFDKVTKEKKRGGIVEVVLGNAEKLPRSVIIVIFLAGTNEREDEI